MPEPAPGPARASGPPEQALELERAPARAAGAPGPALELERARVPASAARR